MQTFRQLALVLCLALLAAPAPAAPGALTVEGVITAVNGNRVTLNGGILDLDVTNATIRTHSDGGSPGVGALVPGAPISAEVSGKGSDGSLTAKSVLVGSPESVELKGALDAVDAGAGTLSLLGMTVSTDAQTAFTGSTSHGPVHGLADLAAGDPVEVEAVRTTGGSLLARHVHGEGEPAEPEEKVEVKGTLEKFSADSWTISGTVVAITGDTVIHGTPVLGARVEGTANRAADGTLTAISLSVEESGGDDGGDDGGDGGSGGDDGGHGGGDDGGGHGGGHH